MESADPRGAEPMHQRRFVQSHSLARQAILLAATLLVGGASAATAPEFKFARALPNPNAASGDQFGYSVAFVGANLLVGAPFADVGGTDAGAAYLFDGKTGELLL